MSDQSRITFSHPVNLWFTGILLLIGFSIWLSNTNQSLFIELNYLFNHLPGRLLEHVTAISDVAVAIILSMFLLQRPQIVLQVLIGGIITGLIVQGMKHGIALPRPGATLPADAFDLHGPLLASSYSFPSGHSATIMVLVAPLILHSKHRALQIVLLVTALVIASARIAVGAHWPLDVIFGVLIAWWVSLILHPAVANTAWANKKLSLLIITVGISLLTIYAAFFHDTAYDTSTMQSILGASALMYAGWNLFKTKKETRHP